MPTFRSEETKTTQELIYGVASPALFEPVAPEFPSDPGISVTKRTKPCVGQSKVVGPANDDTIQFHDDLFKFYSPVTSGDFPNFVL